MLGLLIQGPIWVLDRKGAIRIFRINNAFRADCVWTTGLLSLANLVYTYVLGFGTLWFVEVFDHYGYRVV